MQRVHVASLAICGHSWIDPSRIIISSKITCLLISISDEGVCVCVGGCFHLHPLSDVGLSWAWLMKLNLIIN